MSLSKSATRSKRGLRPLLGAALLGVAAVCASFGAASAAWPERDVTILVHTPAGSSTDVMARAIAKALENVTGKNVNVMARGREAMVALQSAEADGYTLSTQTRSFLADLASGRSHHPADAFQWVGRLVGESYAYGVQPDSPWASFQDLVKDAKSRPGQISMSTFRTGSTHQIAALVLNDAAGAEFNIIPFDSGGDIVIAMLGGNADVAATNPSALMEHIAAGKARALVVTASERHPDLPDVPTAKELGYDVEQYHWRGLIGKAGIPAETLAEIDAALSEAVKEAVFADYVEKGGLDMLYLPHDRFGQVVSRELPDVERMMKSLGLIK